MCGNIRSCSIWVDYLSDGNFERDIRGDSPVPPSSKYAGRNVGGRERRGDKRKGLSGRKS